MIQVQNYISQQSIDNQEILYVLREIVINANKQIEEQFKWKIPFYKYDKKGLCYLNVNPKGILEMGFMKGFLLVDNSNLLESQHLKQIRHLKFSEIDTIDFEAVDDFIQQSIKLIER